MPVASQPDAARPSRSPLSIPIFRAVWIASLASNFGALIQSVGASWLMTSLTRSPQLIALVQASTTLPLMLLSLWAGAIADNLDRRKVMLTAQLFMLAVSLVLTGVAWAGWLSPWLLLAFTFLIGCGTALNGPAWQASVGDMVPRATLPGAVALNSMGFNIARSAGPAVGGAIVAAAGAAAAFMVNALSYLGLIVVLFRWRPERAPQTLPRERIGVAMAAGLRYVAMSPALNVVMVRACFFGLSASSVSALMPIVARDLVTGGPLVYGVLLGAFGIGAVAGALGSVRLRGRYTTERMVSTASAAFAFGAAVVGLSGSMLLTVPALMIAGAGWVVALSTFNVTIQTTSPRWVVARAIAIYQMTAFGGMAIGSWLFGALAASHGVHVALLLAAAMQVASILLGRWLALPQAGALNLDPLNRFKVPDTAVPIEARSGPIVVTIEYRIAEENVTAFLTAMSERRRIRRRDGARGWTLLRDLGAPELWTERYDVATWTDMIRHNQRRTQADAESFDKILALHEGPEPPRIRRLIERQTGSLPTGHASAPHDIAEPMTDPARSA